MWSDDSTQFLGTIFVRGGAIAGNGGFIETSGKQNLLFDGRTDRTAVNGKSGLLLLDPKNITVATATVAGTTNLDTTLNNGGGLAFNDLTTTNPAVDGNATLATLTTGALASELANGSVTLQANNNIRFSNTVDVSANTTGNNNARGSGLTLQAGNSIFMDAAVKIALNQGSFTATINHGRANSGSTTTRAIMSQATSEQPL